MKIKIYIHNLLNPLSIILGRNWYVHFLNIVGTKTYYVCVKQTKRKNIKAENFSERMGFLNQLLTSKRTMSRGKKPNSLAARLDED